MGDAERVRVLGPVREGVGARVAVRTRVLGVPLLEDVLEVTAWEPPRRLQVKHHGVVRGRGEWTLEPVTGGTLFRWLEDMSMPPPLLGELALLAYRPLMRGTMRRSLARLAGLLASS